MTSKKQLILLIVLSIVFVLGVCGGAFAAPQASVQTTTTTTAQTTLASVATTTTTTMPTTITTTTTTTTVPTITTTKHTTAVDYEVAKYIWSYFKKLGWNDSVAAGVMGNIMTESGGQSLKNIQWWIKDSHGNHYGICQWSLKHYPEIDNASLDKQLDFLASGIEKEINSFGYNYKSGFNYQQFLELDSVEEAALAFAKSYERCRGGSGYDRRTKNAKIAYNYFVG